MKTLTQYIYEDFKISNRTTFKQFFPDTYHELRSIIYERLKKCAGNGATVIMVSHRQTNFDIPDEIVYMDHGCIVESGSFEKLCDSQGFFQSWINCDGAGEAEC